MSRTTDLQTLIAAKQRRLQKHRKQQARMGIETPPHVLIEIEDIEAELEEIQAELACLGGAAAGQLTMEGFDVATTVGGPEDLIRS